MKNTITLIIAVALLLMGLGTKAFAEERMMVSTLMPADVTTEELIDAPKHDGHDPLAGYSTYQIDYRVPRHLSLQSLHLLHGNLAEGPYTSRHLDFGLTSIASDLNSDKLSGAAQIGAAALTSFAAHELGHLVVADQVGAEGLKVEFMTTRNGTFFLGSSTYQSIPDESRLPFSMGGEVFSDYTFEYALESYRKNPSLYNKTVMFMSGLDLLRYTVYSFYLTEPHDHFDPVAVTNQTGFSKETLLGVAVAKTVMNAYRIYSGEDRFIPYFDVDTRSATFNVMVKF